MCRHCTGLTLEAHLVWLETKSPAFDPKLWFRLLPNGLQWLVIADDSELQRCVDELIETFTCPDNCLRLTVACLDVRQQSASVRYDMLLLNKKLASPTGPSSVDQSKWLSLALQDLR